MKLLIGVGNPWRRDDGAGLELVRQLGARGTRDLHVAVREGDQAGLIEDWRDAEDVVIVDAASSGCRPGTIHRHDAARGPLPVSLSRTSSHAFGVAEAWTDLDDHALGHRCEQAIRNYDPCISCATHFLDLTVEHT